jgi:phosphonate transport system permease protein
MQTLSDNELGFSKNSLQDFTPPSRRPFRYSNLFVFLVVIFFIWLSANQSGVAIEPFFDQHNLKLAGNFLSTVLPPYLEADYVGTVVGLAAQTFYIAVAGTFLGLVFAFPLALAAMRLRGEEMSRQAQGTGRWLFRWILYYISRTILNITRAVPELVWALFAILFVGLGPFTGVVALALHTTGILGKLYAEILEAVDQKLVETVRSTGAREGQVLWLARIPLTLPALVTNTLFRWEDNMRAATVLGFVAAGGLGNELVNQMKIYQYSKVATNIIALLILVTLVELLGQFIRGRLLEVRHTGQARKKFLRISWLPRR